MKKLDSQTLREMQTSLAAWALAYGQTTALRDLKLRRNHLVQVAALRNQGDHYIIFGSFYPLCYAEASNIIPLTTTTPYMTISNSAS